MSSVQASLETLWYVTTLSREVGCSSLTRGTVEDMTLLVANLPETPWYVTTLNREVRCSSLTRGTVEDMTLLVANSGSR